MVVAYPIYYKDGCMDLGRVQRRKKWNDTVVEAHNRLKVWYFDAYLLDQQLLLNSFVKTKHPTDALIAKATISPFRK